jgi:pimeloyl-ACP methyl ester carboxylesterase
MTDRVSSPLLEHQFDTGRVSINYAEGPDSGPPLVLIHGGSSRWQSWRRVIDPLAERFHLYATDLRGHGRSTWTPGHYRLFDHADDIASFLEHVAKAPAILLGHSLGGEIAMIVAALHPSLVRAVINEDAPLPANDKAGRVRRAIAESRLTLEVMRENTGSALPDEELMRRIAEIPLGVETGRVVRFGDAIGGDQDELRWWAATLRENDPAMIDAVIEFEQTHAGYDEALFASIECPVMLLLADPELGGFSDEEVAHAKTLLRGGRWIRADGLGHSMHIEDPEWFVGAVLALIDDL